MPSSIRRRRSSCRLRPGRMGRQPMRHRRPRRWHVGRRDGDGGPRARRRGPRVLRGRSAAPIGVPPLHDVHRMGRSHGRERDDDHVRGIRGARRPHDGPDRFRDRGAARRLPARVAGVPGHAGDGGRVARRGRARGTPARAMCSKRGTTRERPTEAEPVAPSRRTSRGPMSARDPRATCRPTVDSPLSRLGVFAPSIDDTCHCCLLYESPSKNRFALRAPASTPPRVGGTVTSRGAVSSSMSTSTVSPPPTPAPSRTVALTPTMNRPSTVATLLR